MTWLELSALANKRVLLGPGALVVCLDKRGLDLTQPEISLSLPPDGERISEDGTKGYLSGRVTE